MYYVCRLRINPPFRDNPELAYSGPRVFRETGNYMHGRHQPILHIPAYNTRWDGLHLSTFREKAGRREISVGLLGIAAWCAALRWSSLSDDDWEYTTRAFLGRRNQRMRNWNLLLLIVASSENSRCDLKWLFHYTRVDVCRNFVFSSF